MTSAGRAPAYALGALLLALWAQPSEAEAEAGAEPAAFEAEPNPPTEGSPPPEAFTPREERLLSPIDEDQPAYEFAVNLFGRPLRIGGIAETRASGQIDVPFKDRRVDDIAIFRQKLTIGYFYKISDDLLILLKGGPVYRSKWTFFESHPRQEEKDREDDAGFEGNEFWLYAGNLARTPVSLQVGRQRIYDERRWWWGSDEELDALRFRFDRKSLHLQTGLAERLVPFSTFEPIDPEDEDVLRLLSQGSWEWTRDNRLEAFALRQWDLSDTETLCVPDPQDPQQVCPTVDPDREDPEDGDITWLGLSARGRWKLRHRLGKIYYWTDTAIVQGRETSLDFSGTDENRTVGAVRRHIVRGYGFDLGATWEPSMPGHPSLTLGYARGSGDGEGKNLAKRQFNKSDTQQIYDSSFRQTSLQDNEDRLRGVTRLKYYGELLEPELSNLRITTASLGLHFLTHSSVALAYHVYRQVKAAKFLRDATIRRQPAGRKRGIGHEVDLVVGLEEWEHVEVKLVGAAFRAGSAFGSHCDDDDDDDVPSPAGPEDCSPGESDQGEAFVPDAKGDWSYLASLRVRLKF